MPAVLPGLARGVEREGLAGARRRPNDVGAVAAESQPRHDLDLVLTDRRTRGQRRVDGGLRRMRTPRAASIVQRLDEPLLHAQQDARRVARVLELVLADVNRELLAEHGVGALLEDGH